MANRPGPSKYVRSNPQQQTWGYDAPGRGMNRTGSRVPPTYGDLPQRQNIKRPAGPSQNRNGRQQANRKKQDIDPREYQKLRLEQYNAAKEAHEHNGNRTRPPQGSPAGNYGRQAQPGPDRNRNNRRPDRNDRNPGMTQRRPEQGRPDRQYGRGGPSYQGAAFYPGTSTGGTGTSAYSGQMSDDFVRRRQEYERRRQESIEFERQRRLEAKRRADAERARRLAYEKELQRRRAIEKAERKKRRKRAFKVFRGRAFITLIVFIILALIAALIFTIVFTSKPDGSSESNTTYVMGRKEARSAGPDLAYRNGVLNICFNDVADYLGMSCVGGAEEMKFVIPDTAETVRDSSGEYGDEYISFLIGTTTAYVNGQTATLSAQCFLSGELTWVPFDTITKYMEGVEIRKNGDTVTVLAGDDLLTGSKQTNDDGEEVPETAPAFKLKNSDAIELDSTLAQDTTGATVMEEVKFTADLSAYEEYFDPADNSDYLLLVNYENLLDASYIPPDLTAVVNTRNDGRETQQMRLYAEKALEAFFIEMNANGISDVSVTSAYRSYEYQQTLFSTYTSNEIAKNPSLTQEQAEEIVATYSARPGTSEHQTGLACDMHNLDSASTEFQSTDAYKWMSENAWKFGFILRFPEGKEDITKISFEPWHYRYVGRTAAYEIYTGGYCLEEYVALKKSAE